MLQVTPPSCDDGRTVWSECVNCSDVFLYHCDFRAKPEGNQHFVGGI